MSTFSFSEHPHRRFNPLTREWILVSPHRTKRPWQGQVEKPQVDQRPEYDPTCYLCPGNERAGGKRNPEYTGTYVFDNDYMALLPNIPSGGTDVDGLLVSKSERGLCRVVCFSPKHNETLPQMSVEAIGGVVKVWTEQYEEIGALPFINHVQIFENKGAMMGCSNPHPHGQIWSNESVPYLPALELDSQASYLAEKGRCLLCDYLALEVARAEERIICENDDFVALVPFWAVWPFEAMILPRRHMSCLSDLTPAERLTLADIIKRLTTRLDNLFQTSFPYSMGIHQAPTDGKAHREVHMHWHFYPPLLRSATVKKFMVGYEMLGNPQRDITAESAAKRLRELSETRFA